MFKLSATLVGPKLSTIAMGRYLWGKPLMRDFQRQGDSEIPSSSYKGSLLSNGMLLSMNSYQMLPLRRELKVQISLFQRE